MNNKKPTLFLDRDGVINVKLDNDYIKSWSEFDFIDGSIEAISILREYFDPIFVITNQQGIGKGLMTESDLENIHQLMLGAIARDGGNIRKAYYCPHLAISNCSCRKPKIGMFLQAKQENEIGDLSHSWMVGDSPSDIEAGKNAMMTTVFIGRETMKNGADYYIKSLAEFAQAIKNDAIPSPQSFSL